MEQARLKWGEASRNLDVHSHPRAHQSQLEGYEPPSTFNRSISEPIFEARVLSSPNSPSLTPNGLAFPALKAASPLHQRHQADLLKYGLRSSLTRSLVPFEDDDGDDGDDDKPQLSGDLRRTPTVRNTMHTLDLARTQGAGRPGISESRATLVRETGNPSTPAEQTFAMQKPFPRQAVNKLCVTPMNVQRRRKVAALLPLHAGMMASPLLADAVVLPTVSPLANSFAASFNRTLLPKEKPGGGVEAGGCKDAGGGGEVSRPQRGGAGDWGEEGGGEEVGSATVDMLYNAVVDGKKIT